MVTSPSSPPQVRCRQIRDPDAVADLLAQGFPAKPRKYWTSAPDRLSKRIAPDGAAPLGCRHEAEGAVVGALLLSYGETGGAVCSNVSSWISDAPAPSLGLAGVWFKDRGPRYFRGPERPRLNDLAFTEMVVFGPQGSA
jgi:hypothetical protein